MELFAGIIGVNVVVLIVGIVIVGSAYRRLADG